MSLIKKKKNQTALFIIYIKKVLCILRNYFYWYLNKIKTQTNKHKPNNIECYLVSVRLKLAAILIFFSTQDTEKQRIIRVKE